MTVSRNTLAHIRYGYGLRPDSPKIEGAGALIAQLQNVGPKAQLASLDDRRSAFAQFRVATMQAQRKEITQEDLRDVRRDLDALLTTDFIETLICQVTSHTGFTERLASFWADHFTVSARGRRLSLLRGAFVEDAIRPHLAGSFSEMLIASTFHPAMVLYLDQTNSIGPNSPVGRRQGKGLNENLAREILELHTLGVGGGYDQTDVREFAELLTGLRLEREGVTFGLRFAEPGPETVLDVEYGDGDRKTGFDTIKAALRDIAKRPETARHIATKLVTHFVDDTPDPALIAHVSEAFLETEGDLTATYTALLNHPSAWVPELRKVKQPQDYVASALRAFGFNADVLRELAPKDVRQGIVRSMIAMGQYPFRPAGPDGWPEDAAAWITPATLSARIEWATALARTYGQDIDPRQFLKTALADASSQNTQFLVAGSESKWEGVALALASPEFNRR